MTAESIEQLKARLKREDEEKEKAFQKRLEEVREGLVHDQAAFSVMDRCS